MLILKEKSETITVETDGKVDVYASWRDIGQPPEGQSPPIPNSVLKVFGGGGEQTVVALDSEFPVRQIMAIIMSCRDQKEVRVTVWLSNGDAKVQLFAGALGVDKNAEYTPARGFALAA